MVLEIGVHRLHTPEELRWRTGANRGQPVPGALPGVGSESTFLLSRLIFVLSFDCHCFFSTFCFFCDYGWSPDEDIVD